MEERSIRVLLIEDNLEFALHVQELMKDQQDALIWFAHEAQVAKGLERLDSGSYDLVLLDLSQPGMSSIDAFLEIYVQNPSVPIIVLAETVEHAATEAMPALREGAQECLAKSELSAAGLLSSIQHAIWRKKREESTRKAFKKREDAVRKTTADTEARLQEMEARLAESTAQLESEKAERRQAEQARRKAYEELQKQVQDFNLRVSKAQETASQESLKRKQADEARHNAYRELENSTSDLNSQISRLESALETEKEKRRRAEDALGQLQEEMLRNSATETPVPQQATPLRMGIAASLRSLTPPPGPPLQELERQRQKGESDPEDAPPAPQRRSRPKPQDEEEDDYITWK